MYTDHPLNSTDPLTELAKSQGISSWLALTEFVRSLPYGRNKNRVDFDLVISEKRGSCSSKHALLKILADLNQIPDTKLILGIYKMNSSNTPKIGSVLKDHSLAYIPEAHCYLKINEERIDFTSAHSTFSIIEKDLIKEIDIEPGQVSEFKVSYHQAFLNDWIQTTKPPFDFHQIWKIREQCIENLASTGEKPFSCTRENGRL